MTRREIRELIFKMVFRVEFHDEEEIPEQLRLFMDTLESAGEEDRAYIEHKVQDILTHLEEIDVIIDSSAQNWKTSRMAKVELTLIRLAVYEIRYDDEIPFKVAVNEAVELAKQYGTNDSPAFVNGILAKFAE